VSSSNMCVRNYINLILALWRFSKVAHCILLLWNL
jgi:hypothetical protein